MHHASKAYMGHRDKTRRIRHGAGVFNEVQYEDLQFLTLQCDIRSFGSLKQ
jgi:hypothetical protein